MHNASPLPQPCSRTSFDNTRYEVNCTKQFSQSGGKYEVFSQPGGHVSPTVTGPVLKQSMYVKAGDRAALTTGGLLPAHQHLTPSSESARCHVPSRRNRLFSTPSQRDKDHRSLNVDNIKTLLPAAELMHEPGRSQVLLLSRLVPVRNLTTI